MNSHFFQHSTQLTSVNKRQPRLKSARGQSVVEFAMVLPFMLMVALGVIEMGYALYEDHLIIKLAREGANLISRNTKFVDAGTALQAATAPPVAFNANGKLILSVVKLGTGGANLNLAIISQRLVVGTLSANSILGNPASSAYNGSPDYNAISENNDTTIRVPGGALPNGLTLTAGQSVYITEVYTRHNYITPFDKFGYKLPSTLYAAAFF